MITSSVSEGTRKHVARHIFFLLPSQPASGRACSSVFFYESQSFSPVPYINQKNRKKKKRTKPKQRKQEGRVSSEIFIMSPESKRSSNGSQTREKRKNKRVIPPILSEQTIEKQNNVQDGELFVRTSAVKMEDTKPQVLESVLNRRDM